MEEKIMETYDLFQYYYRHGNYRSAVVYLATIFYCFPVLNNQLQKRSKKLLENLEITNDLIQSAKQELENKTDRVERIISVGSKWNEDEVLLLVQLRIEIDILRSFLKKFDSGFQVNLSEIDLWFDTTAISTEHKKHFDYAIKMIKKNWVLPVVAERFNKTFKNGLNQ